MKMKYLLSSLLSFAICISAAAQNSNPGVDYYALGEIKLAKEAFQKQLNQSPAESYYYLGEIALEEGNPSEAKTNYEKGLAADAENPLNKIGLAKLALKTDPKNAKDDLTDIRKKNKKNVFVIIQVAKAFFENGMTVEGDKELEEARKADKKSPWIYLFEGDMLAKQNKAGEAAAQYDQARNFDPNFTIAYVKAARIYDHINPRTAIEMLNKVTELQPDYTITYKYLGDVYYNNGLYSDAIKAYQKYFAAGDYTVEDIRRYASCEYFEKNYVASNKLIQEGLQREPNNFILNRLLMYNNNELQNYDVALQAGQKFFSIEKKDSVNYIPQDYTTYANVLMQKGEKDAAMAEYNKAIELDPTKVSLFEEFANNLSKDGAYPEAAEYQKMFIAKSDPAEIEATDYYQLGRYYYMAGSQAVRDSSESVKAEGAKYLLEADTAFATVAERVPDSYLGFYWRANSNALLDPGMVKGLAKPYYEKMIEVILAKDDHSNDAQLKEAYQYMAVYYLYQSDDKTKAADKASNRENAKQYAEKLLELSPGDATATQIIEYMK